MVKSSDKLASGPLNIFCYTPKGHKWIFMLKYTFQPAFNRLLSAHMQEKCIQSFINATETYFGQSVVILKSLVHVSEYILSVYNNFYMPIDMINTDETGQDTFILSIRCALKYEKSVEL